MSPSDHEDDLEQPQPLDPWPPAGARRAPGYERYAGRTPTVQRRIDRRRAPAVVDSPGHEAGACRPAGARNGPEKVGRSRLVAVAVLLLVAVVFAVAGAAGASGSEDGSSNAATVPFSLLPLTPEYLKEGAETSTTAYPDMPAEQGTGIGESASDGADAGLDAADTATADGA